MIKLFSYSDKAIFCPETDNSLNHFNHCTITVDDTKIQNQFLNLSQISENCH